MKSLSKNDRLLLDAVLTNNSDVIESLLTMGANPNHLFNDDGGISPFHIIVGFEDLDLIKLFLENNADVNLSCNNLGWTPMHVCAYWDKPDALKLLLEQNQADPFKQCNNQKTVLETAIQNNSKSCIAVIEEYFRNRNNGQKKVQTVNKSSDNQIESHSYRLPHISNHFNQTELDANQISMDETQIQNKTVVISSNDDPDCLPFKSVQHSQSKKDEMREFHPPNNSHSYTNNLTPKKID